jgi:putative CocE/NonD family hydrolase
VYDPSNPVPTKGGNNLPPGIGGSIPCGPLDQSVVDARADVLLFETSVLENELALTGPIFATLYVSSDAVDTDFVVKLSDVYPTGQANLIQDSAVRMRWRNGGLTPEYLNKRDVYEIEISLWNTSFVVAPGHKLRVAVTSSNWPRFSVNPNNGLLLADPSYPGENITATNTLYHSLTHASKITLPVVSKKLDLPKVHVIEAIQETYPEITYDAIKSFGKKLNSMMGEWKSDKPKKK